MIISFLLLVNPMLNLVLFWCYTICFFELLRKVTDGGNIQHVGNEVDGIVFLRQQISRIFHPFYISVLHNRISRQILEIENECSGRDGIVLIDFCNVHVDNLKTVHSF